MPIRTDKIYDRNTKNYIDSENLLKYEPSDNTIRTLIDEILIKLDNLEGLNVSEINVSINDWINKLDDIQNEYERLFKLLNDLADTSVVQEYLDKINEINNKISQLQTDLENQINDLKSQINDFSNDFDNFKNKINSEVQEANNTLNKILNPDVEQIIQKIYLIADYTQQLLENKIYTYTSGVLSRSSGVTLHLTMSRYIFESGNTYLHYCFTDTETTNYMKLINPITGESKQYNDCGSTSGSSWSCCDYHNQDLRYLLKNQDDEFIKVDIYVYQRDYKGFGYLKIWDEDHPFDQIFLNNKYSKIIDYTKIPELEKQAEAIALCDMYKGNYPLPCSQKYVTGSIGDSQLYRYINCDGTNVNNSGEYLWFQLPPLDNEEYEVGILTFDFETNESTYFWIESECEKIDIPSGTMITQGDIVEFKLIEGGKTLTYATDEIDDDLKAEGWELFCPHTKEEYEKARQYLISIGKPTKMGPLGIYYPSDGTGDGNWIMKNYPLNSNGLGKMGWKVKDGSPCWWAADTTSDPTFDRKPMGEPNGDYTANAYLGITYNEDGYIQHYNDNWANYHYTDYLLVKRNRINNYTPTKITSNYGSRTYQWWTYNIDLSSLSDTSKLNLFFEKTGALYNVFDFYFRKKSYNDTYEFKTDENETIYIIPHFSISKLPITWSGIVNNQQFFTLPPNFYLAGKKDYTAYVNWKSYEPYKYYYKISFDVICSGSWDSEYYKIFINDKLYFADNPSFSGYDRCLSYNTPFCKFEDLNNHICEWTDNDSSHRNVLSNGHDAIGHFEFILLGEDINNIKFYNGLDQLINDEMFSISNVKIEQLPYCSMYVANYNNKWDGLDGYSQTDIVATDQVQLLVFSGEKTYTKTFDNLKQGKMYKLRVIAWGINTVDTKDICQVYVNNNKLFGDTLSAADANISNCLRYNYTKEGIYHISQNTYNLTTDNINEFYDANRFNAINGKISRRAIIEVSFIATGNDKIEIKFSTDQDLSDEAYGLESVEVYSDSEDLKSILSKNVTRIETGFANNWKTYNDNGIYLDVDTSMYGFTDNVKYFTSLYGNSGNWMSTGETSIYNASKNGFRVYIYNPYIDDLLNYAINHNWGIHWIGVDNIVTN